MNANTSGMSEIRELTADELESVTGGLLPEGTFPQHLGPHSPGSTWNPGGGTTRDPTGLFVGFGIVGAVLLALG